VDALPHLSLTRGEVNLPFSREPIDLSSVYINMLSIFSVFVPRNFLDDRINEYHDLCLKSGKLVNKDLIFKTLEEKFQSSSFQKIFDEFMKLLYISGDGREALLSRYKQSLYAYISARIIESEK
jgi:hypothetical protein